MSDTPRTDSAANESIVRVYETSKQLERELAEAIAQRHEALEALEGSIENYKLKIKAKAAIAKLKGKSHE